MFDLGSIVALQGQASFQQQNRSMAISATLSEEDEDKIIGEILVRLDDAAALLRCVTTCKRWCRIVCDPDFMRRWLPTDRITRLHTFFSARKPRRVGHMMEQSTFS
jgi:hypothetical protein